MMEEWYFFSVDFCLNFSWMDEHWKSTGKINSRDFKNFLRCLIIVKSIIKDR